MFEVWHIVIASPDFSSGRSNLSAQEEDNSQALGDGLPVRGDCFIPQEVGFVMTASIDISFVLCSLFFALCSDKKGSSFRLV